MAALIDGRAIAVMRRGRLQMLASNAGFAVMGLIVRMLPPQIGSHQKVFFRSFLGLLLLLAFFRAMRRPIGAPRDIAGLVSRGAFGGFALILFFYSIDHSGLVKATLYCYTYPIFAALLAWPVLRERVGPRDALGLALAAVGTVLTLDSDGWLPRFGSGDAAGLASGALSGAAVISIRKLHRTDTSTWIVISFTAVSSLLVLPLMAPVYVQPSPAAAAALLAIALLATVAQLFMTAAYRHLPATEGSVLALGTVPLSAILSMLALNEPLSARFWVGAGLIFAASVMMSLRRPPPPGEPVIPAE